jgi:UDP-N-acetylmuramoyl-tripeptide--D-alanyl-D-alanine ligase
VHDAVAAVRNNVDGTEVVLVKASRASRLELVAEALVAESSAKEASP